MSALFMSIRNDIMRVQAKEFVKTGKSQNEFTDELLTEVDLVKQSSEWEAEYMHVGMSIVDAKIIARAEMLVKAVDNVVESFHVSYEEACKSQKTTMKEYQDALAILEDAKEAGELDE